MCVVLLSGPFWVLESTALSFEAIYRIKWALLGNGCVAICLNISSLSFMRIAPPSLYALAGMLKDLAIIAVGSSYFGENFTSLQSFGFFVSILCTQFFVYYQKHGRFPFTKAAI